MTHKYLQTCIVLLSIYLSHASCLKAGEAEDRAAALALAIWTQQLKLDGQQQVVPVTSGSPLERHIPAQSSSAPAAASPTGASNAAKTYSNGSPGAGYLTNDTPLTADGQPTPMVGVAAGLNALRPQGNETLIDYGCGFDARWLISAVRYFPDWTGKAIGVEIDPQIADSARQYVEANGMTSRIEIITGDSTKLDIKADIGVAYMWPEVLTQLKPKIEHLDRFVSFGFPVPDLEPQGRLPTNTADIYVWKNQLHAASVPTYKQVPITREVQRTVRVAPGSYCQVCGRHCRNPMQHVRQQQIIGYKTVPTQPTQPTVASQPQQRQVQSGHWEYRRVCRNGVCRNVRMWVAD